MSQLAIEIKERVFNESVKKIRKNGEIPGVIYGEFMDNTLPIKVNSSKLKGLLKYNSKGSILSFKFKDEAKKCVVKQVQKDNLTGEILHVDFQYVKSNEVIKMSIPINYIGQENLESKKLFLETFLPELEVQGEVEKIPEYIEIDVSKKNYEDKIFSKDIELPEEIKLVTKPDILLALVNG